MKIKNKINNSFLTDGYFSEKDFLLAISAGVFFLFVTVGLIMALFQQEISLMYLSLLDMVSPVVMTIVGGVFGINIAETVVNRPSHRSHENVENRYESHAYGEEDNTKNEDDVI